jgi:hypothetical protein
LGGSPKWVEQEQKIFVAVSSWTWTSSPITGSYFDRAETELSTDVAILEIIEQRCARVRILSADPAHVEIKPWKFALRLIIVGFATTNSQRPTTAFP